MAGAAVALAAVALAAVALAGTVNWPLTADGTYPKLLERRAKTELVIIDDSGLAALADSERRDLLEILEDRYSRRATLLTSQLPVAR